MKSSESDKGRKSKEDFDASLCVQEIFFKFPDRQNHKPPKIWIQEVLTPLNRKTHASSQKLGEMPIHWRRLFLLL